MLTRWCGVTRLLKEAFSKASELPHEAQDDFARWLLDELVAERRWGELLDRSGDALSKLANEALSEDGVGETELLDPKEL